MEHLIRARGLCKSYNSGAAVREPVLDHIDLDIPRGEFLSIMGASGSGKSTLLNVLSGMDMPTSGSAAFLGVDYRKQSDKELSRLRLEKMGFIFQQIYLLKNLSLLDNILLPAYQAGTGSKREIMARGRSLMESMGIWQLKDREVWEVSGGQLQRAGICRALVNRPQVIFADEPTGALNSRAAAEIMDILCRVNREGTTVLLVTHDPRVAARTERILCLRDGRILDDRRPAQERVMDSMERETWLASVLSGLGI